MRHSCSPVHKDSASRMLRSHTTMLTSSTAHTCSCAKRLSGQAADTEQFQSSGRALAAVAAVALMLQPYGAGVGLCMTRPAQAHVAVDKLMQQQQQPALRVAAGFDPAANARGAAYRPGSTPSSTTSSSSSRRQLSPVASAASHALQLLSTAQSAAAAGDYQAALQAYSSVVQEHPDLALAEYARLGRAIMLYQLGDPSRSILALEDQEISMRGYPEVHAALAAVLYSERPAQRLRAEQQWDIALEFDSRYQNLEWVAENKHWPPALMQALQRFLMLQ